MTKPRLHYDTFEERVERLEALLRISARREVVEALLNAYPLSHELEQVIKDTSRAIKDRNSL